MLLIFLRKALTLHRLSLTLTQVIRESTSDCHMNNSLPIRLALQTALPYGPVPIYIFVFPLPEAYVREWLFI